MFQEVSVGVESLRWYRSVDVWCTLLSSYVIMLLLICMIL